MKKLIALAAVAVIATVSAAHAEDAVKTEVKTEVTAPAAAAVDAKVAVDAAKEATLKDGTKVSIEGDKVFVVAADGTKTPAPDAEHELADGTKVKTHAGVIVK